MHQREQRLSIEVGITLCFEILLGVPPTIG